MKKEFPADSADIRREKRKRKFVIAVLDTAISVAKEMPALGAGMTAVSHHF